MNRLRSRPGTHGGQEGRGVGGDEWPDANPEMGGIYGRINQWRHPDGVEGGVMGLSTITGTQTKEERQTSNLLPVTSGLPNRSLRGRRNWLNGCGPTPPEFRGGFASRGGWEPILRVGGGLDFNRRD